MFIVVGSSESNIKSLQAYLYAGQSIVSEPTGEGSVRFVIVDTGNDSQYRAEYLQGRLYSGMFSARVFETRAEAENCIATELAQR